MSGQKIIDGLQEALDGKIARVTTMRVWREGACPYCQGTGQKLRAEVIESSGGAPASEVAKRVRIVPASTGGDAEVTIE